MFSLYYTSRYLLFIIGRFNYISFKHQNKFFQTTSVKSESSVGIFIIITTINHHHFITFNVLILIDLSGSIDDTDIMMMMW